MALYPKLALYPAGLISDVDCTPTNPISGYFPSIVPFAVNYCDYVEKHNRLIMKQIRKEEKKAGLTKSKHEPSYSEAEASSSY